MLGFSLEIILQLILVLNSPDPPAAIPVNALPSPAKLVAVKAPVDELNAKLLPVFGGKFPVAAVTNRGKQVVSDDSSAEVTLVAVVAVAELPVQDPDDPVQLPVTSPVRAPVNPPATVKTLLLGLYAIPESIPRVLPDPLLSLIHI